MPAETGGSGHSLPKERRLNGRQIREFFRDSGRLIINSFRLYFRKNALPYSRMAVIAGRKYGNSVARNREKRLLREFFRHRDFSGFSCGYDLVIRLERPAVSGAAVAAFGQLLLKIENEANK